MRYIFQPERIAQMIMLSGVLCAKPATARAVLVTGEDNEDKYPVWSYDGRRVDDMSVTETLSKLSGCMTGFYMSSLTLPGESIVSTTRLQRISDAMQTKTSPRSVMCILYDVDRAGWHSPAWNELLAVCPNLRAYAVYEPLRGATALMAISTERRFAMEMTDVPLITVMYTADSSYDEQGVYALTLAVSMSDGANAKEGDWSWAYRVYDKIVERLDNLARFRTLARSNMLGSSLYADMHVFQTYSVFSTTNPSDTVFTRFGDRAAWLDALGEDKTDPLAWFIQDADIWCPMKDAVRYCAESDERWTG